MYAGLVGSRVTGLSADDYYCRLLPIRARVAGLAKAWVAVGYDAVHMLRVHEKMSLCSWFDVFVCDIRCPGVWVGNTGMAGWMCRV